MPILNAHTVNATAGTGPDRTARLEAMLSAERDALRAAAADTWAHHVAGENVRTLEDALETSQRNDALRAQREADIAARRQVETAAAEERRSALAEAEAASLRQQYAASNPGASDAEIDAALPALVAEHRAQRMRAVIDTSRTTYRSML